MTTDRESANLREDRRLAYTYDLETLNARDSLEIGETVQVGRRIRIHRIQHNNPDFTGLYLVSGPDPGLLKFTAWLDARRGWVSPMDTGIDDCSLDRSIYTFYFNTLHEAVEALRQVAMVH